MKDERSINNRGSERDGSKNKNKKEEVKMKNEKSINNRGRENDGRKNKNKKEEVNMKEKRINGLRVNISKEEIKKIEEENEDIELPDEETAPKEVLWWNFLGWDKEDLKEYIQKIHVDHFRCLLAFTYRAMTSPKCGDPKAEKLFYDLLRYRGEKHYVQEYEDLLGRPINVRLQPNPYKRKREEKKVKKELEETREKLRIIDEASESVEYAQNVVAGRYIEGEDTIAKDYGYSAKYAYFLAEKGIPVPKKIIKSVAKSSRNSYHLAKILINTGKKVPPILIESVAREPWNRLSLAALLLYNGREIPKILLKAMDEKEKKDLRILKKNNKKLYEYITSLGREHLALEMGEPGQSIVRIF